MPITGINAGLTNSLNTIVSTFKLKRQDSGVARRLATQMRLEPHSGSTKYVNYYSQLTAYGLSDLVDMAQAQQIVDNQTSYVPAEVGVQLILADTAIRRSADPDLLMRAGRIAANAVDLKEDTDGLAQASNFTAGTIPNTGNPLTPGSLATIRSLLRTGASTTAMPAPPPYYGVFHPYSLQTLVGRTIPYATTPAGSTAYLGTAAGGPAAGATTATYDMMREGPKALTRLHDIDIFEDANVAASTNDRKNMVFAKEGLVYVLELAPYYAAQRDESLRATELNIITSYVFGTYLPANYGVYALADGTTPTA